MFAERRVAARAAGDALAEHIGLKNKHAVLRCDHMMPTSDPKPIYKICAQNI